MLIPKSGSQTCIYTTLAVTILTNILAMASRHRTRDVMMSTAIPQAQSIQPQVGALHLLR
jgi:hypothetical protein